MGQSEISFEHGEARYYSPFNPHCFVRSRFPFDAECFVAAYQKHASHCPTESITFRTHVKSGTYSYTHLLAHSHLLHPPSRTCRSASSPPLNQAAGPSITYRNQSLPCPPIKYMSFLLDRASLTPLAPSPQWQPCSELGSISPLETCPLGHSRWRCRPTDRQHRGCGANGEGV